MFRSIPPRKHMTDLPFSVLVLFILVWFTYGILFKAPYSGFFFNPGNGQVTYIYNPQPQEPTLQIGDILVKVGDVSFQEYNKNNRVSFFKTNKAGDVVQIVVMRNGIEQTIPWRLPGLTHEEYIDRQFNIWELAYIFWFFGSLGQLLIRPRDKRWLLFVAANYLTAIWLVAGSLSSWHIWESSILLRAFTWLLLPVYLHLHWIFPHPFKELPKTAQILLYAACLSFAIAEVAQVLPGNWYAFVFMLTLLGSIILEIAHFIRQTDRRRDVFLVAFSIFIAFIPTIGFSLMTAMGHTLETGPIALFSMPFMPMVYFYVIYRHQLGGLEMRTNRLLSLYAYLILFGTVLVLFVTYIGSLHLFTETLIFIGSIYTLTTTYIAITMFPTFQTFVEKIFFGVKLPYKNLQETYSNRITASASMPDLLQILDEEVLPSLLVRQYTFLQVVNGELKSVLAKNVSDEQINRQFESDKLDSQAGTYLAETTSADGWIRLILPLKVGDRFIGFWLLGQRDPDDYYPQAEIPILQSLANQTAVALSNIQYAEQLRKMYQTDIERNENERMHLALELHDSILNELAVLRTSLGETSLPAQFQNSYDEVTHRLREIVSDLRPPMLMYGLVPAIHELADNLMERNNDRITIKVDIDAGEERLPQNIEQHLFRITQEACENSLRHGQAKNIDIFGYLIPHKVELNIVDDGTGFDAQTDLNNLINNNHFGLAGMVERTHLIGAKIEVQSVPNLGTKIHVAWAEDGSQDSASVFIP